MAELWVKRIASGDTDLPWKPDVPDVQLSGGLFAWKCLGGIPTDKVTPKQYPDPITEHLYIWVPDGQKQYVTAKVDIADVPEEDQLTVQMIRDCGVEYDEYAEAFFASIPNLSTGTVARKEMGKRLLLQAQARGLSDDKAERIKDDYGLPEISDIG